MNQDEPPRIQQEGRTIQVGKEATSRKTKPTKSEIEERRGESHTELAKEYGVARATIYNWFKIIDAGKSLVFHEGGRRRVIRVGLTRKRGQIRIAADLAGVARQTIRDWAKSGIDITDLEAVRKRKSLIGIVRKSPKNQIPGETRDRINQLSIEEGISWQTAYARIKKGTNLKGEIKSVKTTIPHMGRPSYWNQCVMTEYSKEIKSFPDWSCIWSARVANDKRIEKWKALSIEERRAIGIKSKKQDPKIRQAKLNEARRKREALRPELRTINSLRSRFKKFFKGGKSRSIRRLMGCTLPEFKKHLESQFAKGMTWENYGSKWHIDHILPCSSFDHTDFNQVKTCWHWTNLRPLCAIKNMQKGKAITNPQMSLLIGFAA